MKVFASQAVMAIQLFDLISLILSKFHPTHRMIALIFIQLSYRRKVGNCVFSLRNDGGMLYWGGEYTREINIVNNRRGAQMNNRVIPISLTPSLIGRRGRARTNSRESIPMFEFRIMAGAPMKSR